MASNKNETTKVGENVEYRLDGDYLTVVIDLSHRASDKPAEGKKTIRVASTLGNVAIPGADEAVRVGINVFAYPPR